jgi:DNA-directed RNA polymerase specialized sigma24 family protein
MTDVAGVFPSQNEALRILQGLAEGDPLAPSDVAAAYLEPLARWLARTNPQVDASECDTAAEDAILWLIKHPASYDPAGMSLEAYLRMAARRDLQNVRRAEGRHASRRADWGAVELSRAVGKHTIDVDADPARIVELQEMVEEIVRKRPRLPAVMLAGLSPGEVQALALVECGERRTELYASALGISHLPPEQQQAEVKRVKDRLKARLKRVGVSHD